MDRSFDFYQQVLGFKPVARWDKGAYLECGNIWLALVLDDRIATVKRPDYSHIAFSCSSNEFNAMVEALKAENCVEWSENKSEGASFYFQDPNGHKLEIHVGNLATRLKEMKENPWADIQFFRES